MELSSRVKAAQESVTLTVNDKINELSKSGKHIYNLTAGQLPFKPASEFIKVISGQLNFLKSYQYSPIGGFADLQSKFINYVETKRKIDLKNSETEFDCIISNGSKHTLYNIFGALLNPGDEVILLTPYWVSYPEMVKFWGGVPKIVQSNAFDAFTPHIDEIKKVITKKTKAIIINSPNNPAGIHYSDEWMQEFATFLKDYPDLIVVSDELYSEIAYFDPAPTYFYQHDPSLLKQTVIVDGISKSFACTGLRIGFCIADKVLTDAISKLQSQTTSGPNSLIQKSLIEFDFNLLEHFFDPVKIQLRECAQVVRKSFREANLSQCWYQTTSGFYYFVDFSRMPIFENYKNREENKEETQDYSEEIVKDILEETGVALVPGSAFGYPNSARMSMTIEIAPFQEAMNKLVKYLANKN
jgi:aspartate aminotransferase